MKQRYRMKINVANVGGIVGSLLKIFPNALTVVGYPTDAQMEQIAIASAFLGAFGVTIEVTPSN